MDNYEKIKSMSIEEMAEYMTNFVLNSIAKSANRQNIQVTCNVIQEYKGDFKMTNKEVIIDGKLDRELLYSCEDFSVGVDGKLCQFGKEQPLMDIIYELALAYKRKGQECENWQETARKYAKNMDYYQTELKRLQSENKELKKKNNDLIEKLNFAADENKFQFTLRQERDRYKQALEEVKNFISNKENDCNKYEDYENGYCIGIGECEYRKDKQILNKINEALKDG